MASAGHFLAFTITKIELFSNGKSIGNATGFFLKKDQSWFLVTNWHVFSGRDNITGQPRHGSGAIPDQCQFYTWHFTNEKQKLECRWNSILLLDPYIMSPTWAQHPTLGQEGDIAALPLGDFDVGLAKDILDSFGHDDEMFIDLGHEVFLPGYPLGFSASGNMAIWKRASIASPLEFGDGKDKLFYVDTATREGMSGSPCIALSNWSHYSLNRTTGEMRVVKRPISWRLLGIYSGRINPSDSFEAQIGIVWRENLIYETISAGVPGLTGLRLSR